VYAVIHDRSRQFTVRVGDQIHCDVGLSTEPGTKITFDKVQLVSHEGSVRVGKPFVKGASVQGEVIGAAQGDKLVAMRFKRRKNVRRKTGHRQDYVLVKIAAINA